MDNMHPVMAEALAAARPPSTENERLRALQASAAAAYDKALLDPQARIPTYLHAALEALRK